MARPYPFIRLNQRLIAEAVTYTHFQVAVIDASFISKSGQVPYGIDGFYNSKASRTERGLEMSMIVVVDVEQPIGSANASR